MLNKYKIQMIKTQNNSFEYLNFGFWVYLGFRVSDL